MAVKAHAPTSPGRRFYKAVVNEQLTKVRPERSLLEPSRRKGGRNNTGRITMRHRGGGARQLYRVIDFTRSKLGVPGTVASIEYDPNRNAHIALVHYVDGDKRYILHPVGVVVGSKVLASPEADIIPGNALPIKNIPVGTSIHNIALKIGGRGQLCRTAGAQAQLVAKDTEYAQVRMPSGEVRKIHVLCWATIGQVGNTEFENMVIGKAGRNRLKGWRPFVRGMAMNPVDHPHGGGEGRSKGGNHPCSPTGVLAKGYKTRNSARTDGMIVKRRR